MCKLKYWVNGSNGFVTTCNHFGNYHLDFGTAIVLVTKAEFEKIAPEVTGLLVE